MATHRVIEFDDLLLEGDVHKLMEHLDEVIVHIEKSIPDEVLYAGNGEPNVRTHWGAVFFHVRMARSSLKAFM